MTLSDLFAGAPDVEIGSLEYDSRQVRAGALFFCVRGFERDGHEFAAEAVRRGAAALVVERPLGLGVPEVEVPDARAAMAPAAARFFDDPSAEVEVIGITGTNGKTTTAFLLREVLAAAGRPCGMVGTVKTVVAGEERAGVRTTPEAIDLQRDLRAMADGGDRACALEVSSVGLTLHRADAIRFAAAVFTNFSPDHLDFHGTMDAYWQAKRSLFERVEPAHAIVNVDDERGRVLAAELPGAVTYAVQRDADVRALDVEVAADGARFDVVVDGERLALRSRLPARFNVDNVLAAVTAARVLGVEGEAIARGVAEARPAPGRLEPIDAGQPFAVVVDYAHSSDSVRRALDALREGTDGRLIAVLGANGPRFAPTRAEMGALAAGRADALIASSDHPDRSDPQALRDILRGADGAGEAVADRAEAIARAVSMARPGDTVAILGGELPGADAELARTALGGAHPA